MRGLSQLSSLLLLLMFRITVSVRYFHASQSSWTRQISSSVRPNTNRVFHRASFSLERQLHCRGGESIEAPFELASESPPIVPTSERFNETASTLSSVEQSHEIAHNVSSSRPVPAWKRDLPSPLCEKGPKTLQKLVIGQVEIYLIGTAHVSNDSSSDVNILLNSLHPDAIFVELCESRIPLLEGKEDEATPSTMTNTSDTDMGLWDRIRNMQQQQGGSVVNALSSVLLTSVQEDYASELGVELGGEFRAAYRYWQQRQESPNLILGDRPLHLTLIRAWESLWWWPKVKVMAGLLWSSWQKPDKEELRKWLDSVRREESDVLTESLNELRKHFPTLHTCIIEERDAWLSAKLVQVCRALSCRPASPSGGKQVVVAIVGAGHVPGMSEWLTKTNSTETPEQVLSRLVTTRRFSKDAAIKQMSASWINEVTELQSAPDSARTGAHQQTTTVDDTNTGERN
jgi:pheromone shutdown protein TraB